MVYAASVPTVLNWGFDILVDDFPNSVYVLAIIYDPQAANLLEVFIW